MRSIRRLVPLLAIIGIVGCQELVTDAEQHQPVETWVEWTPEGPITHSSAHAVPFVTPGQSPSETSNIAVVPISSGDLGGADLTPSDGDLLSGDYTNVGTFTIPAGATVHVATGTPLSVSASTILIDGTLDATGAGFAGGAQPTGGLQPGNDGSGPGGGEGADPGPCVHTPGGGGGGYGGAGGHGGEVFTDSPPRALGGGAYGTPGPPGLAMGSGGGSSGTHCSGTALGGPGGDGGGSLHLVAASISVDGKILASGATGGTGSTFNDAYISGGGGGAGGGIWLDGALSLTGTLEAAGGDGGQVVGSSGFGTGGGGGGGGRIKLAGCTVANTASISVSGGAAGSGSTAGGSPPAVPPADGSTGTYTDVTDASCVVSVELDILPGSEENPIKLDHPGSIPVAILSHSDFDATTEVDRSSLTFGATGDEESLSSRGRGVPNCGVEDIDHDDLYDLVCQFDSNRTGFEADDTEGVLKGETTDDVLLTGRDAVRILN